MLLSSYLYPSTEAIDFQMSSNLGKALTDLFQSVMDYRDNIDYGLEDREEQRTYIRIRKVYSYFKDKIAKKFIDTVEKECGLIISKLHLDSDPLQYGIAFDYAVNLQFDNWDDACEMIEAETALGHTQFSRNGVNELEEVCNNLDLHKSKITTPYFGKGKKRKITCEMWFSVSSAFLLKDLVIDTEYFTAREIAAIMMHEIGHMMSVIEYSANVYHSWSRAQNWLKISKDTADLNYIFESFDKYAKLIDGLTKELSTYKFDPTISKYITNVLGIAKSICNAWSHQTCETIEESSSFGTTLVNAVSSVTRTSDLVLRIGGLIVTIAFRAILDIVADVVFLWTAGMPAWLYHMQKYGHVDRNKQGHKSSDTLPNENNVFLLERWADEFVARHGYGADVASALNKLDDAVNKVYMGGESYSYTFRNSGCASALIAVASFMHDKLNFFCYFDPVNYENQYNRNLRLLQDMYGVFRDEHITPTYKDYWIKQIQRCKESVEAAKKMTDTELGKAIGNALTYLLSPAKIYHLFTDANLAHDVKVLEDRLNDFHNNPLFYLAATIRKRR